MIRPPGTEPPRPGGAPLPPGPKPGGLAARAGLISRLALAAAALAAIWQALAAVPDWPAAALGTGAAATAWLAAGRRRRLSALSLGLIAFGVTAAVGVWAAFDRSTALGWFYLILNGVWLGCAVAAQPSGSLGLIGLGGMLAGCGIAVVFVLGHDWVAEPADFAALNQLAILWMNLRPALDLPTISANIAGGLIAALAPLGLLVRPQRLGPAGTAIRVVQAGAALVCATGLLLSSSRGAWAALAAAALAGLAWTRLGPTSAKRSGWWLASLSLTVILASASWLAVGLAGRYAGSLDALLPGAASAQSRAMLSAQSLDLLADFGLTGAGLGTFAALFSRYVMVYPWFYYGYAHSLPLDLALSQGLGGLAAWIFILWLSVKAVLPPPGGEAEPQRRPGGVAVVVGLVTLVLHGMIDDPFYASRGVVLLFVWPGLASYLARSGGALEAAPPPRRRARRRVWLISGAVALGVCLTVFGPPFRSRWYSTQASLDIARQELADWPDGVVGLEPPIDRDGSARAMLERAIALDPSNRTAHHRLGILALNRGDLAAAVDELAAAWQLAPGNRGVRKTLAYALAWSGELQQAQLLLADIPEASDEMGFYAWWWATRSDPTLAARSAQMEQLLLRPAAGASDPS